MKISNYYFPLKTGLTGMFKTIPGKLRGGLSAIANGVRYLGQKLHDTRLGQMVCKYLSQRTCKAHNAALMQTRAELGDTKATLNLYKEHQAMLYGQLTTTQQALKESTEQLIEIAENRDRVEQGCWQILNQNGAWQRVLNREHPPIPGAPGPIRGDS